MAALVLLGLVLAFAGGSDATWCVCKSDVSDAAAQKTIDYACGAGADCSPILQNGACYQPNTVKSHCSYAANSYFQRKGQAAGTCDFSGTAMATATDPSYTSCSYPSTAASAAGNTTTTPPSSATPTATNPTGTPTTFTPTGNGVLGGLGPAGATSISPDGNGAGNPARAAGMGGSPSLAAAILLSGLVLFRG